jgi:hypothetical protein
VVLDEEIELGSGVPLDRSNAVLQSSGHVLGEDLRAIPHLAELTLEADHLVRDGVTQRGSRVELVDRLELNHFVATTT